MKATLRPIVKWTGYRFVCPNCEIENDLHLEDYRFKGFPYCDNTEVECSECGTNITIEEFSCDE